MRAAASSNPAVATNASVRKVALQPPAAGRLIGGGSDSISGKPLPFDGDAVFDFMHQRRRDREASFERT